MSEVIEQMDTFGLVDKKEFTMKNSVKAFNILSDSLYMNKVLAVIRELSCNAYDAHLEAGTAEIPFEIHLPDEMAPYFFIRDFGTGLGHNEVLNLYTTYFDSTKSDSTDATGALGLGSKSPFAVVDDFTVVSYQEGKSSTYFAYKNEQGFPCISFISEDMTETELNGIKIQFAVRRDRFADYKMNLPMALYHFEPKPTIFNVPTNVKKETIAVKGDKWEFAITRGSSQMGYYLGDKPIMVMARISYPLDVMQLEHLLPEEDHYLLNVCKVPLRVYVDNRSIDHTPSREHLQYNKKTVTTVRGHLKKIYDEILLKVNKEFAECSSISEVHERCKYLKMLEASNVHVDPWKSKMRVFGPGEFKFIVPTLDHLINVGTFLNYPVNLKNIWKSCGAAAGLNKVSENISVSTIAGTTFKPEQVQSVFQRIEIKSFDRFISVDILTDDEIKNEIKNTTLRTYENVRDSNLNYVRDSMRRRRADQKHSAKFHQFNGWKTEIDIKTGIESRVAVDDFTRANIEFGISKNFIDTVFVIDDYPKEVNAISRAGYARMCTRDYFDFVVFSDRVRSGGRFIGEELDIVEATVRAFAAEQGIKVIRASELLVPEIISRSLPRPIMSKKEYCAFNILQWSAKINQLIEIPAGEMPEDFQLPGFNDENVIYLRRHYDSVYLFGDEDEKNFLEKKCKMGNSDYCEVEELIKFFSIFAGKNLLEGKMLIVVKNKNQLARVKKGKWKSITSVLQAEILKMTNQKRYEMITTLSLSQRTGILNFLKNKMVETMLTNIIKDKTKKSGGGEDVQDNLMHFTLSSISGVFANLHAITTSAAKIHEAIDLIDTVKAQLCDSTFKTMIVRSQKYFEYQQERADDSTIFGFYSVVKNGTMYNPAPLLIEPSNICKILYWTLGKSFIVQMIDFVLECQNLLKRYPMLGLYSTKFTKDESLFISQNVGRALNLIPGVVTYINLIERATPNV